MSSSPLLARLPQLGEKLRETDAILDRFLDYTIDIGLELYPAQEEAILELFAGKNVVLNTPTGSGKSLVGIALHFLAMCQDQRSVYTSPIKALVNEKFFALCDAFHPDNVGLLTGDATVNRDAPIICCTAEVFSNMALREGSSLDIKYAVVDEFHFYGDRDRGVAWQIPLLTLPETRFLLMSATLGETKTFEDAMTKLNGAPSCTVSSTERPVPLSFFYQETPLHETIGSLLENDQAPIYIVSFSQRDCHTQAQNLMSINICDRDQKAAITDAIGDFRFDTPYGKTLKRFLRHGIGVHHGGLLPKYRRLVERLAQTGLLKIISGTDTLGVGVNVPIRSVVLTKLCKFDGHKMRILSVRDFHQISGRAGRKGFDDAGTVAVQAPEHVIANLKLAEKAKAKGKGSKSGKSKKGVSKKPPERGYVHYDRQTFDKLVGGKPASLTSRFNVSHGMLLNLLGRDTGGCEATKALIASCHEPKANKHRHAKTAIQMFMSLLRAGVVEFLIDDDGTKSIGVNIDLQREFSLNQTLSLFVVETCEYLERDDPDYAVNVLSVVESVLEDPTIILRKQLDRIKTISINAWKAEGMEYDERMAKLDELTYPRPNASIIERVFDEFSLKHPWVGNHPVRPKGVAREVFDQCFDFQNFIKEYQLAGSEGTVLRYLSNVYKTLVQSVPSGARTESLDDLVAFFEAMVTSVDSSLVDEWEQKRDPNYVPPTRTDNASEKAPPKFTDDRRAFTVLVRNAAFRLVTFLARGATERMLEEINPGATTDTGGEVWTAELLRERRSECVAALGEILTTPTARGTRNILIAMHDTHWTVTQKLLSPDDDGDDSWFLRLRVDLDKSNEASAPWMELEAFGN